MNYNSLEIYDRASYKNLILLIYTDGKEYYFVPHYKGREAEESEEGLREILSLYSKEKIVSEKGKIFEFEGEFNEDFENFIYLGKSTNAVCFFDSKVLKSYRRIGSREPEIMRKVRNISPEILGYGKYDGKYIQIITSRIYGKDLGEIFYQNYLKFLKTGEINEKIFDVIEKIVDVVIKLHEFLKDTEKKIVVEDIIRWRRNLQKFAMNANIKINTKKFFSSLIEKEKMTTHQDLHLSQMLMENEKIYIIDFEGEPLRENRNEKFPHIRDFSTVARSFGYITKGSWNKWEKTMVDYLYNIYAKRKSYFGLRDYYEWMVEKALYEVNYEMKFRPNMVEIPLKGVKYLLRELEVIE